MPGSSGTLGIGIVNFSTSDFNNYDEIRADISRYKLKVDYALIPVSDFGLTHSVSIIIQIPG